MQSQKAVSAKSLYDKSGHLNVFAVTHGSVAPPLCQRAQHVGQSIQQYCVTYRTWHLGIDQVSIQLWFTIDNAGPTLNQHWPNVDSLLWFRHSTLTISMLSHSTNAIYGICSWDNDNSPFDIALWHDHSPWCWMKKTNLGEQVPNKHDTKNKHSTSYVCRDIRFSGESKPTGEFSVGLGVTTVRFSFHPPPTQKKNQWCHQTFS